MSDDTARRMIEAMAREWVFESIRRDYSFYDDATCRDIAYRAEGDTRFKAFMAGFAAALREQEGKERR